MRLTCPCCGAMNSIESLINDAKAREAVVAALAIPNLGDRVLRYLGLFRPRQRALSWDRATRLLEELTAAITAGEIDRDGKTYPAPLDAWKAALDDLLDRRDKLSLPLNGHGYLFEIIAGQARQAQNRQAQRQEIADEQAKAREGNRSGTMQPVSAVLTPEPEPARQRTQPSADFRALLGKLTGKMAMPAPTAQDYEPPA